MRHQLLIRKISGEWVRLAIAEDSPRQTKKISVLLQSFPLPNGYSSVEALNRREGVIILDALTAREIARLGCCFENTEELWADILPVISNAYMDGWQAGRTSAWQKKGEDW